MRLQNRVWFCLLFMLGLVSKSPRYYASAVDSWLDHTGRAADPNLLSLCLWDKVVGWSIADVCQSSTLMDQVHPNFVFPCRQRWTARWTYGIESISWYTLLKASENSRTEMFFPFDRFILFHLWVTNPFLLWAMKYKRASSLFSVDQS